MTKYKKIKKKIDSINDKTSDKDIFEILDTILKDDDLKQVSGIYKSSFPKNAMTYFKSHNRFSDKYRVGVINTLNVYSANLVNSRLV